MYIIFILLLLGFLFIYFKFIRKLKVPKTNSVTLVSGGVKCGKSTFSVYLVLKAYKSRLRAWKIRRFFARMFHLKFDVERPLIYSNVPLNCEYYELTLDHLLRRKRFNFGSVVYLQESSFVADSMLIKDCEINKQLQLFIKLFGQETHGGLLVLDTHTISDNHFAIKRGLSEYFYIHHLSRLPFFILAHCREFTYSDDNTSIINVFNNDTEDCLKKVLIPKRVWKMFDTYAYSYATDKLPTNNVCRSVLDKDLKARYMVSFRKDFNIDFDEEVVDEKKVD